ncbi:MAG: hypothetical protein WEG36_06220 [Gemmatimonadota bacterium]
MKVRAVTFSPQRHWFVGEIAHVRDGSFFPAYAMIDAIDEAGADAAKLKVHIAAVASTREEPWNVSFARQHAIRCNDLRRREFGREPWQGLRDHAEKRDLNFVADRRIGSRDIARLDAEHDFAYFGGHPRRIPFSYGTHWEARRIPEELFGLRRRAEEARDRLPAASRKGPRMPTPDIHGVLRFLPFLDWGDEGLRP